MIERRFIAIPEHFRWREVMATSPEMAYRKICSDYMLSKPICILDLDNRTFAIYTRKLDRENGRLKVEEQTIQDTCKSL